MEEFYIYAHYTLDTNELFYIGKGKNNRLEDTWGRNRYWHKIVDKHGFRSEILVEKLQEPDAFIQEILAIKKFKPRANITKGGSGGYTGPNSGNFQKGHIPWNTGKKCPQISKRQIGDKNPMYGKQIQKPKKIKCLNDDKIFNSIQECFRYYGISKSGMYKHLKDRKPIKNMRFKYV